METLDRLKDTKPRNLLRKNCELFQEQKFNVIFSPVDNEKATGSEAM